jgi:hypothetical protein
VELRAADVVVTVTVAITIIIKLLDGTQPIAACPSYSRVAAAAAQASAVATGYINDCYYSSNSEDDSAITTAALGTCYVVA